MIVGYRDNTQLYSIALDVNLNPVAVPLTDAEYEDAYAEALLCLADDGHAVGEPFINGTGARYCLVDDRKLTDREVLELWWKADIASEILQGR